MKSMKSKLSVMVFRKYISINEMRLRMHKYQTKQIIGKSHILWQYQRKKVNSVCALIKHGL